MIMKGNEDAQNGNFKEMAKLHHITSGMKAIATTMAYDGIDELR
jgi:hypothetical protein